MPYQEGICPLCQAPVKAWERWQEVVDCIHLPSFACRPTLAFFREHKPELSAGSWSVMLPKPKKKLPSKLGIVVWCHQSGSCFLNIYWVVTLCWPHFLSLPAQLCEVYFYLLIEMWYYAFEKSLHTRNWEIWIWDQHACWPCLPLHPHPCILWDIDTEMVLKLMPLSWAENNEQVVTSSYINLFLPCLILNWELLPHVLL